MYFPNSAIPPNTLASHQLLGHIARLEAGLALALDSLQTVIDRLESKFGDDLFSDRSRSPSILQSVQEAERTVDKLDQLVKHGQQSVAVRELRAEFSLTWDQAQGAYNEWSQLSRHQKVRRLRLVNWMDKIGMIEPKG